MYKELYEKNQNGGCPLITQAHYNEYVSWIWAYPGMPPTSCTPAIRNAFWKYHLLSPVDGASLFRDNRGVATFKTVFDIITTSHGQISHAWDIRKNKKLIDESWYGVPESTVKLYLALCTECIASQNATRESKMNPL